MILIYFTELYRFIAETKNIDQLAYMVRQLLAKERQSREPVENL